MRKRKLSIYDIGRLPSVPSSSFDGCGVAIRFPMCPAAEMSGTPIQGDVNFRCPP